jgi:zinc-binding alcohol dehydrogenase/oxidoreductase
MRAVSERGGSVRAARLVACGDPPAFSIDDVPAPVPGAGEVVVALRAAALNRRDPWIWTDPGYCPLPVTLGSDGAGVVQAVGDGVEGFAPGDEVVVNPTLGWPRGAPVPGPEFDILGAPTEGTFAEQVRVPVENVAPRPARLSWHEAAALSLGGLTAWRAVAVCARAGPGRSVLVTGAGGGVATFAVQIAAALGARVYVSSSSDAKLARAREIGGAGGFRYTDADWPEQVRAATGGGVDAVVDSFGAGSWPASLAALRRGGVLVSYGDTGDAEATFPVMEVYWEWRSILGTSMGSPDDYDALLAHVETAAWRPVVDAVYPLERIADAAHHLERAEGRFGKVVLEIAAG